jgi:hypothetical protein
LGSEVEAPVVPIYREWEIGIGGVRQPARGTAASTVPRRPGLGKLGFGRRAQLAAWVGRGPPP